MPVVRSWRARGVPCACARAVPADLLSVATLGFPRVASSSVASCVAGGHRAGPGGHGFRACVGGRHPHGGNFGGMLLRMGTSVSAPKHPAPPAGRPLDPRERSEGGGQGWTWRGKVLRRGISSGWGAGRTPYTRPRGGRRGKPNATTGGTPDRYPSMPASMPALGLTSGGYLRARATHGIPLSPVPWGCDPGRGLTYNLFRTPCKIKHLAPPGLGAGGSFMGCSEATTGAADGCATAGAGVGYPHRPAADQAGILGLLYCGLPGLGLLGHPRSTRPGGAASGRGAWPPHRRGASRRCRSCRGRPRERERSG